MERVSKRRKNLQTGMTVIAEAEITTRRHLFDGVFDYVFMHLIKGQVWGNNVLFTKVYCKQAMYAYYFYLICKYTFQFLQRLQCSFS